MISQNQKDILYLALPIIIGQLSQMVISITDAIMVGQLGYLQLASSSLMISIISVPSFTCIGFTLLISSLVAAKRGQGQIEECGNILYNSGIVILTITLFLVILLTTCFPLINYFGQNQDVIDLGRNFFIWILWSLVPMIAFMSIKQFYDGLELTRIPMLISSVSIILNLFLNFVFIYGWFGFKAYGLEGSGIASFITRILMLCAIVIHAVNYKKLIEYGILHFNLKIKLMREFVKLALPSSWQFTSEVAAFAVLAIIAGWYGPIQQASHQIAITVAAFSYVIFVGLATAASIKIGESFGKKDFNQIRIHGLDSIKISLSLATLTIIILVLFRFEIAQIFNSDPMVVQISSTLLIYAAIFQFSDSLQALGVGMLRGVQDIRIPTLYTTISYWIVGIPIGYILADYFHLEVYGIWIGFIFCLSTSAILLIYRFSKISNLTKARN
ncbi:MAG: MATE family efflux transporter [Saprospiraceae bacterium]